MKYLSHYIQDKQTQAFNEAGAFFAFSNQQFDEAKKDSVSSTMALVKPSSTPNERRRWLFSVLDWTSRVSKTVRGQLREVSRIKRASPRDRSSAMRCGRRKWRHRLWHVKKPLNLLTRGRGRSVLKTYSVYSRPRQRENTLCNATVAFRRIPSGAWTLCADANPWPTRPPGS